MAEKDQVRECLSILDIHKSIDLNEPHKPNTDAPMSVVTVADVIVRPLSIILDRSWWLREVPENWKKAIATHTFKKCKK